MDCRQFVLKNILILLGTGIIVIVFLDTPGTKVKLHVSHTTKVALNDSQIHIFLVNIVLMVKDYATSPTMTNYLRL